MNFLSTKKVYLAIYFLLSEYYFTSSLVCWKMCKVILKIFKGTSKKFCQLWNLFKFVSDVNFLGNYFKFVCFYENTETHQNILPPPKKNCTHFFPVLLECDF